MILLFRPTYDLVTVVDILLNHKSIGHQFRFVLGHVDDVIQFTPIISNFLIYFIKQTRNNKHTFFKTGCH